MTSAEIILRIDQERRKRGISQMRMAELADDPDTGQRYFRAWKKKDCRLSLVVRWLDVLGLEIVIRPK